MVFGVVVVVFMWFSIEYWDSQKRGNNFGTRQCFVFPNVETVITGLFFCLG